MTETSISYYNDDDDDDDNNNNNNNNNNKASSPVFVPKQHLCKRLPDAFSSEVKRSECEADRLSSFRLELRVMRRD